jgi:NADPH-dependent curcumin reductase CurA
LLARTPSLKGAKVIGIAGGADKCKYLEGELKFDHAIDYKKEDVSKALAAIATEGITHYFDK